MQFGKHPDLRAQYLRHHRYRNVVDRPSLVAPNFVEIGEVDSGNKYDGRTLAPRMLSHEGSKLKSVDFRHADVHQNDCDVVMQQYSKSLARGIGLNEVLTQLAKHRFVSKQLGGLVVNHQDVERTHEWRPCLSMQPHAKRGEKLLSIHRLGEVVGSARFEAFFSIAFHGLCR